MGGGEGGKDLGSQLTVHDPGAGVVSVPSKGDPSVRGKHGGVAARRVGLVDGGRLVVVSTAARAEHPEVVAVQVDGVGLGEVRVDDHVDPLVGGREDPGVLLRAPGGVAVRNGHDAGVGPLRDEGDIVHRPLDSVAKAQAGRLIVLVRGGADIVGQVRNHVARVLVLARVAQVISSRGRVFGRCAVVSDNSQDVVDVVVVGTRLLRNGAHPEVA